MLGEAPAIFVHRVLQGLSAKERAMTASLLGYPEGSVGRVMSPEVVTVPEATPVNDILQVVRRKGQDAETIDMQTASSAIESLAKEVNETHKLSEGLLAG